MLKNYSVLAAFAAFASVSAFADANDGWDDAPGHLSCAPVGKDQSQLHVVFHLLFNAKTNQEKVSRIDLFHGEVGFGSYTGRVVDGFFSGPKALNAVVKTDHGVSAFKLISDGEIFGVAGSEEDAAWYGQLVLNGEKAIRVSCAYEI